MVIKTAPEQRRSDVRGDFVFKVKYRMITLEEYRKRRKTTDPILYRDYKKFKIDIGNTDHIDNDVSPNISLIDFLFQIDEKLDRILSIVSGGTDGVESYHEGLGLNISGSGMLLKTDKRAKKGQIIQTNFLLSKLPYIEINLFSEVAHISLSPSNEDGKTYYNLGIQFLELEEHVREKIISRVFEIQRKAIRNNGNQE